MKNKASSVVKYLLLAVPFLLGIIGYYFIDNRPFLQSAYISLQLYGFAGDELPPNAFVELARWVGPVATASGFILIIKALRRSMKNTLAYIRGNSTAVYGPENLKKAMLEKLGKNGIDGTDSFVKADRYILLDEEDKNLAFFFKYQSQLESKEVYARCDGLSAQSVSAYNLHLFCREETSASVFWKKHCIYPLSKQHDHRLNIVFIGFGKLGKELLLSALQNNIFSPRQQLDYHIFGEDNGFCNIYHQLDQLNDNIIFHSDRWYQFIDFINNADFVVVLQQEKQPELIRRLLLATECEKIHIFYGADYSAELLENSDRLINFKWKEVAGDPANIMEISMFKRARKLNLRYASIYNGIAETEENAEKEWRKLDTFTRYSNISSLDYGEIIKYILAEENSSGDEITAERLERLSELEHIRWCRYHYLNNWKYGVAENGSKDSKRRIHSSLLPYEQLSEAEKEKDRENVRILFSFDKK